MKKILVMFAMLLILSLALPPGANAQCGKLRHSHNNYAHTHKSCVGDKHKHGRSFWKKHRDKLTTAGGIVGGAVVGGIVGGKKGALIGAAAGGGGAAVYTYGIRKRRRAARR